MIKSADFLTKRSKVFPVLTFVGHNCVNPCTIQSHSPCQFRFCFNMHQLGGVEKTAIYAKNLNGRLNCRTNLWAPHSIIVGVYSEPKFIVWVLWDLRLGPKLRARAISFQVKFQSFQNAQSLCYILMDIHFLGLLNAAHFMCVCVCVCVSQDHTAVIGYVCSEKSVESGPAWVLPWQIKIQNTANWWGEICSKETATNSSPAFFRSSDWMRAHCGPAIAHIVFTCVRNTGACTVQVESCKNCCC